MKDRKLTILRWTSWIVLLFIGLSLPTLFGLIPAWVEQVYARGLFPWIARILAPIGRVVPFSVAQLVVAVAALLLVLEFTRTVRSWRRRVDEG